MKRSIKLNRFVEERFQRETWDSCGCPLRDFHQRHLKKSLHRTRRENPKKPLRSSDFVVGNKLVYPIKAVRGREKF